MGWNLSYNYMEGPLATRISQSTKLHTRDLSYSSFFGPVPDAFGNSPPKLLNLKAANFTGVLPSSLGNLTNLTEIHLSLANFTPTAGPSGFANLKVLDLSSSNFTEGPIPERVQVLPNLQILELAA
jgi:Leucine-rich repeat (LRR) protein